MKLLNTIQAPKISNKHKIPAFSKKIQKHSLFKRMESDSQEELKFHLVKQKEYYLKILLSHSNDVDERKMLVKK
jgi:hypothetical protein